MPAVNEATSPVATPSASGTAPLRARSVAIDEEGDEDIPEVARRLWKELLCTCGEETCARPTLAACACEYAGKKRQDILDQVRRRGFGSPARDEATYAAVLRDYTARHGSDSTLTATLHGEWLRWVFMVATAVAGVVALVILAEWYRRRRQRATAAAAPQLPKKRWISPRSRRK